MPKKSKKSSKQKPATKPSASGLEPHELALAAANAVDDVLAELPTFSAFARGGVAARVRSLPAAQLSEAARAAVVALFEANMREQYERSDWGYDAVGKARELFEPEARYLVVESTSDGDTSDAGELLAFAHFRFVDDDGVEVLYVYELQVAARAQRRGLGKFLMAALLLVARRQRMKLVVLTVFKSNAAALAFYQRTMGFAVDETSPSACGDASASYEILSRVVDPSSARQ
ncbi:hypothetical protein PybrP1_010883 [[Pythium] brassicae (nom. inval.)]|nr:hypothetical protein PybrP1_010883 [[Pythium] brassicae (nom. inval.)]